MKIDLTNKKALVGGASSGIGFAIAQELAKAGASVVLMSRSEDRLQGALAQLDSTKGQEHSYVVTDFSDFRLHKKRIQGFFANNSVDILVNNTQGPTPGTVSEKSETDYQQAFDLLFQNTVFTSQLALEEMKQKGFGRIINVGSMTVKEPNEALVLSNTMRTAMVSWAKSLSEKVAEHGVTVNTVLTGLFDTERLKSLMASQAEDAGISLEEIREKRMSAIPVKRLGKPEEYGYLVAFIASEYASFLNGTAIPLDGGASKGLF